MKRSVALLTVFFVFVSVCLQILPVSAARYADGVTVVVSNENLTFSKGTEQSLSYTVLNSGSIVGARAYVYIDDILASDSNPRYFMLFNKNDRSISFVVPADVAKSPVHTLTLKLSMQDGSEAEYSADFSLIDTADNVNMKFAVYTPTLEIGGDFSCGVQFEFEDPGCKYTVDTSVLINGVHFAEFDRNLTLSHGDISYYTIPGEYLSQDMFKYRFEIRAGASDGIWVDVPVNGEKTKQAVAVSHMVNPVVITACTKRSTPAYSYSNLTDYCTTIPAGSYVAYLNPDNHNSMRSARVKTQWGGIYWVSMSDIYITTGNYVIADNLTPEQKEHFVNYKGYSSKTDYLVWVNLERQILTVFMGSQHNWKYLNCFPVATGKNNTPTPTVEHEIVYVTRWVTPEYTCYPVLALYDGYAIHNQPVSPRGYVTDSTIGRPASAGCVRMLQKDINWVHSYVPVGTNVVIY